MSINNASSTKVTPPAQRWRLWIDGCGGFLLLTGNRWTLGGISDQSLADVRVRADWPRVAGTIEREGGDYFWMPAHTPGTRELLNSGKTLAIPGSASVTMNKTSPLSDTVMLSLKPPHRFDEHVDGVALVKDTMLIGPSEDCHVRCDVQSPEDIESHGAVQRLVLTLRDGQWMAGMGGNFQELVPGQPSVLQSLAMTLEES